MIRCHLRLPPVNDNHRSANASSIAGDMYGPMVMINIHADELAEPPSSTQFPEVCDETCRIASQADDSSVNVNYECMRAIYLRSSCQTDVFTKK